MGGYPQSHLGKSLRQFHLQTAQNLPSEKYLTICQTAFNHSSLSKCSSNYVYLVHSYPFPYFDLNGTLNKNNWVDCNNKKALLYFQFPG